MPSSSRRPLIRTGHVILCTRTITRETATVGEWPGKIRLRIRYRQFCGHWSDYLLASQDEVRSIIDKTRWVISDIVESKGQAGFVAILEKL